MRKTMRLAWLLLCVATVVQAAPFAKNIEFQQSDGTAITLWGQGDEFYAVFETLDGYTVTFDPATKSYYYAKLSADGSVLEATTLRVGGGDPSALGLAKHLRISRDSARKQALERYAQWDAGTGNSKRWENLKLERRAVEAFQAESPITMSPPASTTVGVKVGLTLLIDFDDAPASISRNNIVDFCNGDNFTLDGNRGSVKQYYLDNSNNLLTYTNIVTVYIRIPNSLHPKSYYNDTSKDCGEQAGLLIRDAIAIMRALPNYESEILPTFQGLTKAGNTISMFNVFYAGGNGGVWTYGLWPHQGYLGSVPLSGSGPNVNIYQITNIGNSLELGTFCHENGHMMCGYPDEYDYGYDSIGGSGAFSLMAYGSSGGNPSQIDAYLKTASGWATITDVNRTMSLEASLVSALGKEGFNHFYRYRKPGSTTEYYLFENRQQSGRDAGIPGAGIAIWHIDELGNKDNQSLEYNSNHKNYEITLVQADNQWHFEKNINSGDVNDLYYFGNTAAAYSDTFDDTSEPSARWWDGSESNMRTILFSVNGETMTFRFSPIPPAILTMGALPSGRVGTSYYHALGVVGGEAPYTWQLISSSGLQSGLSFDATSGVISGMPEQSATVSFKAIVTDVAGIAATNDLSLTISPVFSVPFNETFENAGSLPDGWAQSNRVGEVNWVFTEGSPLGSPEVAHGGDYDACLSSAGDSQPVTLLISPRIDFGDGARFGRLTFWQHMTTWLGDTDELRVYYKTSWNSEWTLLQTYTDSVSQWTQRTLDLPTPSRTYYLAFEGTDKFGYGVCIDDVQVTDPYTPLTIATTTYLPIATAEAFYSQAITATGGVGTNYVFALTSGSLPAGLTFSTNGVISGTPSVVSTNVFTVQVTDGEGTTASKSLTLVVETRRAILFYEDFEHGGQLPSGWSQQYLTNNLDWTIEVSGIHDRPAGAISGDFFAMLWSGERDEDVAIEHVTRLVSPMIDLSQAPSDIRLTFWHCMSKWAPEQDELRVYYKTSVTGEWNLIEGAVFTNSVDVWTRQTLPVPNPSSTYFLAFEGNARFGYGVCVDNIQITDEADAPIITTYSILPSGIIGMAYNQTLAAVGGALEYSWSVLSNSLPTGLSISTDGVISGVPSAGGSFRVSVQVAGSDGKISVKVFKLRILTAFPIPFTETFENSGSIPVGWSVVDTPSWRGATWTFRNGSISGEPNAAHTGQYNANLYCEYEGNNFSMLISPAINLGTNTPNTRMTFWHCMKNYGGDQDELRVYYRTSTNGNWNLLATYIDEVPGWTQQTVDLPNPSSTYYIAFEGNARYGYGVCIDDVSVTGDVSTVNSPYDTWKQSHFSSEEIELGAITGDTDDPDGDGVPNLLEYAMGLDPRVPDTAGLPSGGIMNNHLYLTYRESKAATDVLFEVEACTSLILKDWTTDGVSEILRGDSNLWWQVTAWHDVSVTNAPTRFMRLKVTKP